jgi:hypothetical protein
MKQYEIKTIMMKMINNNKNNNNSNNNKGRQKVSSTMLRFNTIKNWKACDGTGGEGESFNPHDEAAAALG